jgi:hypothetical protein
VAATLVPGASLEAQENGKSLHEYCKREGIS